MINNTLLRYFYVTLAIFIILLVGIFFYKKDSSEKPYQVLTPSVYEKGSRVNLYKDVPPDFPQEVIFEDVTLDYSGSVVSPDGRIQTTVSYVSPKRMQSLVDTYLKSLPGVGWVVIEKLSYPNASIIRAVKNEQSITISIAPMEESGVMVTFQYEK